MVGNSSEEILHVGLLISDLEKSQEFYSGFLGWKEKPRPDFDFPGAWYQIGGLELHLMGIKKSGDLVQGERPWRDGHFAVRIHDFEAILAKAKKDKLEIQQATMFGKRRLFLRDPDGNLIELWEK